MKSKLRYMESKYKNNRSSYCGLHYHDSMGEAGYCKQLQMLEKLCEIKKFETQKTFEFVVNGKKICSHRVDFLVTTNDYKLEVREYKGFETDTWRIKKKLFEALYPEIEYIVVK